MEEMWPKLAARVVRRAAPNQSQVMIGRLLTCVLNFSNVVGSPGQFMRKQIIQLVNGLVASLSIGMFFLIHHGFFASNTIPTSIL